MVSTLLALLGDVTEESRVSQTHFFVVSKQQGNQRFEPPVEAVVDGADCLHVSSVV